MQSKHLTTLIGLIVIAALFFSGGRPAAAQDGGGVGAQADPPCDGTVAPPSSGVLCGQMDTGGRSNGSANSQNTKDADGSLCGTLQLPAGCLTSWAADDFKVPATGGVLAWIVNKVEVSGFYDSTGPDVSTVNIYFHQSTGTGPGNIIYSTSRPVASGGDTGSFTVNLTAPALLVANANYWLVVQANLPPGSTKNWFWEDRTVPVNLLSAWLTVSSDPNGTGCTIWKPRVTLQPVGCRPQSSSDTDPDLMFRLSGKTNNHLVFLPVVSR